MKYKPSIIQIENKSRTTFTYDSFGNEICKLKQIFIAEKNYTHKAELFNADKAEFQYDNKGNLINELYRSWKNDAWENNNRISYTIDDNGNLLKVLWYLWNDDQWVNSARTNYTLDHKGNRIKELYEVWADDSWQLSARSNCTLDNSGNLLIETEEQYNNDIWTNSIKTEYTYDDNGNIRSFRKSVWDYYMKVKWDKPSWLCDYKRYDTYDKNDRLVSSEVILGSGENSRRHNTNFIYDSSGLLESQQDEIGKAKYQTDYTYDTDGNCMHVNCDLPILSRITINCYIRFNNGKDVYKLPLDSNSQVTIEYAIV